MSFFRLLKPLWGQKSINVGGEVQNNPAYVEEVKGQNTLEGCFSDEVIAEKNTAGYNVYWFPNHPSSNIYSEEKKYLNGRDIDVFEWVFVDMDLKDKIYDTKEEFFEKLSEFPHKPTLTVVSGNGVHAYWRIEDLTRELYLYLQLQLIQHFKTDDSIWTVLQLMRWPGSLNTKKHGEFKQTEEILDLSSQASYRVEQLFGALPAITEKNEQKLESHIAKLDGKMTVNVGSSVNLDELPDKFIKLMETDETISLLFNDPVKAKADRSSADATLTNHLFTRNFNRKEALNVLMNSQKALSKGANRFSYASQTVDWVYNDRVEHRFKTVGDKLKEARKEIRGARVKGPGFLDCLERGWRKGMCMGIIAGSGVGKTAIALKIFQDMIKNNPDNDDIFVFFSLEMPEYEIEERWVNLVGAKSPLADRLYVIGNEDENGEPRDLNLQDIYNYCQDLRKDTGKNIASVVIDHIQIVNPLIDLTKKPTFGAEGELLGGKGTVRSLSLPTLFKATKPLAKMLDTFLIALTQTTKGKGGGDTPIGIDGAFGSASYEWSQDLILSIWQPLMRIQKDTDLRVLAWQYVKIRGKHKYDGAVPYEQFTLRYDMDSGNLLPLTDNEKEEFDVLLPIANEARKAVEKKEGGSYRNSLTSEKIKELQAKIYG
jgi:hypothetical protein